VEVYHPPSGEFGAKPSPAAVVRIGHLVDIQENLGLIPVQRNKEPLFAQFFAGSNVPKIGPLFPKEGKVFFVRGKLESLRQGPSDGSFIP
jgi:hypothetical protein